MKRIIVSIGVLLLTLNGFGWYNLKNSTLDTVYEWADKSTWNGTQPTNFVNDAFYCSVGSGASATRTYVNPGYSVDFTAFGLGQWPGQTSIVHVAENAYLGVHDYWFAMCFNAGTGKSYAELHMKGATLKVYNPDGGTTARDLMFGRSNAGGISILDLQQGSVITNGTSGATYIAGAADAVASISVTNSAIYAPSGQIIVGTEASKSSHVSIDLHNGLFYGGSPAAPSSTMSINGGDFALSLSGKSEFKVASFGLTLSRAGQKQSVEVGGGLFVVTNAVSGSGSAQRIQLTGAGQILFRQTGGLVTAAGLYFGGTGNSDPRYELAGGELVFDKSLSSQYAGIRCATAAGTKAGTLSLIGGGALLKTPMFGTYNSKTYQPFFEYVITTNGIPRAQFNAAQDGTSSWLQGFFKIRPQGGLQLVHTNVVNLVDTRTAGRVLSVANPGTGTKLPNEELWDAKLAERGTSLIRDLPVTLVPAAEFKSDTYVEEGRSSGYAVVPKVKEGWKKITVMLDLLPQGDETLETLKAGFEKAGFKASAAEGDYNVAVEIPGELLAVGSSDDKVIFDFKDYPDSDSVRLDTPTVRALVRRCKVVKPATGMILFLH